MKNNWKCLEIQTMHNKPMNNDEENNIMNIARQNPYSLEFVIVKGTSILPERA